MAFPVHVALSVLMGVERSSPATRMSLRAPNPPFRNAPPCSPRWPCGVFSARGRIWSGCVIVACPFLMLILFLVGPGRAQFLSRHRVVVPLCF
jgi:hypothetical protein